MLLFLLFLGVSAAAAAGVVDVAFVVTAAVVVDWFGRSATEDPGTRVSAGHQGIRYLVPGSRYMVQTKRLPSVSQQNKIRLKIGVQWGNAE